MDKPKWDLLGSRAAMLVVLALVGYGCSLVGLDAKSQAARESICPGHLRNLFYAISLYASDWDDRAPFAYNWHSGTQPYLQGKVNRCPLVEREHQTATGYAYDSRLHGLDLHQVGAQERQTLVFESTSIAEDSSDPFTSPPRPGRHEGKNNIGYVDGHVNTVAFPALRP